MRFANGAKGVLMASQISVGCENDIKIRVHGTKGSIWWHQEYPDDLHVQMLGEPRQLYRRGNDYLCQEALDASRIPPGHPEAFLEAFANVYLGVAAEISNLSNCL